MDDRTFILWRGQQRVNFNEDDITADRISAVFRVIVIFDSNWSSNEIMIFITTTSHRIYIIDITEGCTAFHSLVYCD